jgi:outer membrane lipoprotein carrier protein
MGYPHSMTILLGIVLAFFQATSPQPEKSVSDLITGIDKTFARMSDLKADFVQIYEDSLNRRHQQNGHLYLKRGRRMRWETQAPEEQLLVSDGKDVYLYVPADRQVTKDVVTDAIADRMPIMFLVGRSDLKQEFARIETLSTKPFVPGTRVMRMYPKRKTDLKEIVMEVDPVNYQIRRLVLANADDSRSEFLFSNISINTGLQDSLFNFKVPAGVEVLPGIGQ